MFRCLIDLEHTSKLRDGENYILHASLHNVLTPIQMVVTAFVYFTKLQLELILRTTFEYSILIYEDKYM